MKKLISKISLSNDLYNTTQILSPHQQSNLKGGEDSADDIIIFEDPVV